MNFQTIDSNQKQLSNQQNSLQSMNFQTIGGRVCSIDNPRSSATTVPYIISRSERELFNTTPHLGSNSTLRFVRDARAIHIAAPADVKELPSDIEELPSSYVFTIDMPGLKKEDMEVQIEKGNVLVISGERKRPKEEKEGVKYLKKERRMGKFKREFVLAVNANGNSISTVFKDSVLTVTVQKFEHGIPRTIQIQDA